MIQTAVDREKDPETKLWTEMGRGRYKELDRGRGVKDRVRMEMNTET